jgi:hypothetical protein
MQTANKVTALTIDSSQNVGIGTSTPSSFDSEANNLVVGNGSGDNGITIFTGSSAGHHGSIFFGDATGTPKQGQIRYEQNNEVMSFHTNTTERMRIDLNGNVGIGISPVASQKLHVNVASNVNFTTSANSSSLRLNAVNDAVDATIPLEINSTNTQFLSSSVGIGTSPSANLHILNSSGAGHLILETTSASHGVMLDLRGSADRDAEIIFREGSNAKAIIFNDASNNSLSLSDGSGGLSPVLNIKTGSVGIGTGSDTIDARLHVKGATDVAKFQSSSGATNTLYTDSSDSLVGQIEFSASFSQIVTRTSSTLSLGSNNVQTLHITDDDRVGIGEDSPDKEIHLKGSEPTFRIEQTADANKYFDAQVGTGGGVSKLKFSSETASNTLVLGNNNRVAVAGASLDEALNVAGTSTAFMQIKSTSADSTSGISLQNDAINYVLRTNGANSDSFEIRDATNNAQRLILDANSRVSLGNNDSSGNIYNTIFGYLAGNSVASGATSNTLIGYATGDAITTGTQNTAIGESALSGTDDGASNTAIGNSAMGVGNAGTANTAVGSQSMIDVTGNYNTAVGMQSLFDITSGVSNVAVGALALKFANAGESNNIAIGVEAMRDVKENGNTADSNIALGSLAMTGGTLGGDFIGNIAIGDRAMDATGTNAQTGTIAIGHHSLTALTSGTKNVAIGYKAGESYNGSNSTIIGYEAGLDADGGATDSTLIGMEAGKHLDDATYNTAIGIEAMKSNSGGSNTAIRNTAIGWRAGDLIRTGSDNVVIGHGAEVSATDAVNQIAIGKETQGVSNNSVTLGNTDVTAVHMAQDSHATVYSGGEQIKGSGNHTMWRVVNNTMADGVEWDTGIDTSQSFFAFVGTIESDNTNGDTAMIRCASGTITLVQGNQGYITVDSSTVASSRTGFYSTSNTLRVKTGFANGIDVSIAIMSAT